MKVLRTVLYIILAIVLVLVLIGFAGPRTFDMSRTTVIEQPPQIVFPYLCSLKKQADWGPWNKIDPEMKSTYEGEDCTVGAKSSWESEKAGSGTQEVVSIEGTSMESVLTFKTPWGESKSTGYMSAAQADLGTEVTWGFHGENNFIERIMGVFMNMEKSVGPMFETGLQNLKDMVEMDLEKDYNGYIIQVVKLPPKRYVAVRKTLPMDALEGFMSEAYGLIMGGIAQANVMMDGPPSGMYYTWDEETGTTDAAAAIPVNNTISIPGTENISLPSQYALALNYYGSYDKLGEGHDAIDAYLQHTGVKTVPPAIEEYITDPQSEQDPAKWHTRIYYLLDQ
jgi:effector-binding domain-containing protein